MNILEAVVKSSSISALNPMQEAVNVSSAHKIILLSPTGSGKTIAFSLFLFRHIDVKDTEGLQAIVIAPSRELVRQSFDVIRPIVARIGVKVLALYGGNSFSTEEASLRGQIPSLVVATPGRLLDHLRRGTLGLSSVRTVVLDEYDKILDLGFHDEMRNIFSHLAQQVHGKTNRSSGRQDPVLVPDNIMVTSATQLSEFPDFINIADAEIIDFTEHKKVESRLRVMNVPSFSKDKLETLAALVRSVAKNGPIIVFVNHRESAERVASYLKTQKISVSLYHGGLDQRQREIALARFDSRAAKVLVATDLAGRGIDIDGVASVIHYHPAADREIWTHRNGRTARIDNSGDIYVITHPEENIPDFVSFDNDFYPDNTATGPVRADFRLIYFDRGKRDKISRGDIAGFIMKKVGVPPSDVGRISLGNDYALAAVSSKYAAAVIESAKTEKVKNTRVRATLAD